MNLQLNEKEKIRISAGHNGNNFVDVYCGHWQLCSVVDLFTFDGQYIEIREKEKQLRVFQFNSNGSKKDMEFGWWEDAIVVFSFNRNGKDK